MQAALLLLILFSSVTQKKLHVTCKWTTQNVIWMRRECETQDDSYATRTLRKNFMSQGDKNEEMESNGSSNLPTTNEWELNVQKGLKSWKDL